MKSLLILRHATASAPSAPSANLSDAERPLTDHGQTQARQLGSALREQRIRPDRVVCSSAVRARQTAEITNAAAKWGAELTVIDNLYNASVWEILALVSNQPKKINQFCLVAHAPGVAELVSLLTTKNADLALVFAAGTLANVELDIEQWSEVGPDTGALRFFWTP